MKVSRGKTSGSTPSVSGARAAKRAESKGEEAMSAKTDKLENVEPAIGVSLSDTSFQVGEARRQIDAIPDIRASKVDEIRLSVDEGSYKIEGHKVAKKIVDESLRQSARFIEDKKKS